jgi:hypothetical protein
MLPFQGANGVSVYYTGRCPALVYIGLSAHFQLSTLNSQLSTLNSQLSTLNSQLSPLNSQLSPLLKSSL